METQKEKKKKKKKHIHSVWYSVFIPHRNVNRYVACNDILVAFLTFTSKVHFMSVEEKQSFCSKRMPIVQYDVLANHERFNGRNASEQCNSMNEKGDEWQKERDRKKHTQFEALSTKLKQIRVCLCVSHGKQCDIGQTMMILIMR